MKNKKIVIIGTVAQSMHSFRSDMIKALINKNYAVYAFFSESSPDDITKIKSLGAIPVKYNINRGGLNPLSDLKAVLELIIKIKKINPDIVFSFASKAIIFGTIAAQLSGVSKIFGMLEGLGHTFTSQPKDAIYFKSKLVKLIQVSLYRISLPLLDTIIFLNPDDPEDLLSDYGIQVNKVEILGGIGVNLNQYVYQPPKVNQNNIRFLFIGRLLREKGIFEYVNAAKIIKAKYPDVDFTVLGTIDTSNLGALTQLELSELISTGVINCPGHVDNVEEWITKSDVFVLPSYREGVPRSSQEAMAIGRAIITTDVPGCRETVIDGVNGFLVNKWDHHDLAEKMMFFIKHPDQIEVMGKESYKIAKEKFDAVIVNQKLLSILGL